MDKIERPTFTEYMTHLDETLKGDPLMVLARVSERNGGYVYPQNNMAIKSGIEINVIDRMLREKGYEQRGSDTVWEDSDTRSKDYRLRRVLQNPEGTMSAQLFIPKKPFVQEIYSFGKQPYLWKINEAGEKKVGELTVNGVYTFHPHSSGCEIALSRSVGDLPNLLQYYGALNLTDEQREELDDARVLQDDFLSLRLFTEEMADLLKMFARREEPSIFYHANMMELIARNNLNLRVNK